MIDVSFFRPLRFSLLLGLLQAGCGWHVAEDCSFSPRGATLSPKRATSRSYTVKGLEYRPQQHYELRQEGHASWYGVGDRTHGRPTASGQRFNRHAFTAAHRTLPLPCVVHVTNLENGREVTVKVNDRGPYPSDLGEIRKKRIIDLSAAAAKKLGFYEKGVARVRIRTLVPESLRLKENRHLLKGTPSAQKKTVPILPPSSQSMNLGELLRRKPSSPTHSKDRIVTRSSPTIESLITKAMKGQRGKAATHAKNTSSRGQKSIHLASQKGESTHKSAPSGGRQFFVNVSVNTHSDDSKRLVEHFRRSGINEINIERMPRKARIQAGPFQSVQKAYDVVSLLKRLGHDNVSVIAP